MNELFEKARSDVVYAMKEYAGFGTYGEKSIHAVLKKYIEPDTDFHEVGVMGSIADVCKNDKIYEIQTRQLYKLKPKLEKFLPYYKVCVVHPIIAEKNIYNIDPETNAVLSKRKSPLKGCIYDFLPQIYPLRDYLTNVNLSFRIMMIKASDYRLPPVGKGRRKTVKFDTIPDELVCEVAIENISDLKKFLPPSLPDSFGSSDYAKCAHIPRSQASLALNILHKYGIVEKIDKKGNAFIYRIIE